MFRICLILFVTLTTSVFSTINHAEPTASKTNWVNNAETGVFLMRDGPGKSYAPSVLLSSDIDVNISGPVAKVVLKQRFYNAGNDFAEGLYVFPLPENSAINAMQMQIGERRIIGEIHEKAQAKKIYEAAKSAGKQTALLEQQRSNMFTSSVANIVAGETVEIIIEYTNILDVTGDTIGLRIPTTMTPRYSPELGKNSPIAGPIVDGAPEYGNVAQFKLKIDGQLPIADIESSSHDIKLAFNGGNHYISTTTPWVKMDRDFAISWQIAASRDSQAAFYHEEVDGEHYGLLLMHPPQENTDDYDPAREMIFIIDTSGSMGGEVIQQARAALLEALNRLDENDRFNIIEFNSTHSKLYNETKVANGGHLAEARSFVKGLRANGGTEMLPAVTAALNMPGDAEMLRQIIFITDGAVSNEKAIFAAVNQMLGNARLFTVGIGSAPNSYFMQKAAEFGRGGFTHVNRTDKVLAQMSALFAKLENPVLRDLSLQLPDNISVESWPKKIPDLYAAEPVLVAMKLSEMPTEIKLTGRGQNPWEKTFTLDRQQPNDNVSTLWARRKIDALTNEQIRSGQRDSNRDAITQVALAHRLVSQYTSFVAVDKTPVRKPEQPLKAEKIANLNPKGAAYPGTALGVGQLWLFSLIFGFFGWLFRNKRAKSCAA